MKKALVGYGGHAREVMVQMGVKLTCFVDDEYVNKNTQPLSSFDPEVYCLIIAVANSEDRYKILKRLPTNTKFFTFIHPTSLIMDDIEIGEGSFIGANSIITTNVKIGSHALLNRGNHIGHDCVIGDYFTTAPGVQISGNEIIGDRVYFGTRSCVKQKITICNDVIVGMNAGVVKNIIEPGTYIGTPAKKNK